MEAIDKNKNGHAFGVARKVAVVTGASAGIGLVIARTLALQGWRVIALGRDPGRSAVAFAAIRAAALGSKVDMIVADLSIMAEAARAAREIAAMTEHIDVLVNNAGGTAAKRVETPDGFEATFAGNHLGPFLLTTRLLPLLRAAAPGARVINVSSVAHNMVCGMAWNDLQAKRKFSVNAAYAQSKLANILFTRELARRVAEDGIVVNAMHPGIVTSHFASHGPLYLPFFYWLMRPLALTPEQGADTALWLATAPEAGRVSGGYFIKRKPGKLSAAAQDDNAARRLWAESEALIKQTHA